jgi:hypothetical protein
MVGTTSRIICRGALTLALAAGAVLATTTAASAADFGFDMYDANQDGKVDFSVVNTNGDGFYDANLLDVNRNGRGDTWLSDTNQNGIADHVGFDRDEDGRFEAWLVDTDEDDVFEAVFVDKDGDGWPETMALTGPRNPIVDINWKRDVCPTDPFWCMQWPRVSNNAGHVHGVNIGAGLDALSNAEAQTGGL